MYGTAIARAIDVLTASQAAMVGMAKYASAILGEATFFNKLACVPNSPADLTVLVGPGEIYSMQSLEATQYGANGFDLPQDLTHLILKQGILLDQVSLSCPAPATPSFSVDYLVQVTYQDNDTDTIVLQYFDSANPNVPWSGPDNTGMSQPTLRQGKCIVAVKAGIAAATGTQTPPAADSGYTGAYVVTVANGQTQIMAGNITVASAAPFIIGKLGDKLSLADAEALFGQKSQIQAGTFVYGVDSGAANTYVAALSPALSSYEAGTGFRVKIANTNTGASTINVNGLGAVSIKNLDGSALFPNQILANMIAEFFYDGTNALLTNPITNLKGYLAQISMDQTITGSGVALVPFQTVVFDYTGTYSNSTGIFTMTRNCQFHLNACLAILVTTTGQIGVRIYKNSTPIYEVYHYFSTISIGETIPINVTLPLVAGDTINISIHNATTTDLTVITASGNGQTTFVSGFIV